jgi:sugar lactone lactonase YvrE
MGTSAAPDPVALTVNGRVHGGQQPVVGAQIQLYVAGSGGNGSQSSTLLDPNTVTSGTDGGFSITGKYSCPSATSQVYLVATQGNPGLGSGGNNPALAMMAPLGSCGNLPSTPFIWINEVTTAAAAWALAPFTKDIADIGASSTNSAGLANAFLNAQLIANTATGTVATLPSNLTTETGKIYALADAVASCINSDGTTGCSPLFTAATPSQGSAPTNTWDAVVNIVKNPGNNVGGVYSAIGPQPPFATTLTKSPNDWTLSLRVTGGGIASPESLAIDSQGNVWVANFNQSPANGIGYVSAFNPQGTPLAASGFPSNSIAEDFGLAIDPSDNVWVTVEEMPPYGGTRGSLVRMMGVSSGASLGSSTVFANNTINFPYAVAADTNGTIFIVNNSGNNSTNLVSLNPTTNTYTPISTGDLIGFPTGLAIDSSHGVWLPGTDDGGTPPRKSLLHVDATGSVVFSTDCCGPVSAVAVDSSGNVWMADSENSDADGDISNGAVTELASDGTTLQSFITAGGITNPSGIFIDGAQNVWVSNVHTDITGATESISEVAGSGSSSPGSAVSPGTGYGLDANLLLPYTLAADPSGSVWVSNTGGNSLVMFFGLAAPTKTPLSPIPQAP